MVKISRSNKQLTGLTTKTLAEAAILERYDLQEYIFNSPKEFCQELRQDLVIIDKEVPPSETVADRIDLLALDRDGSVVIIELKRGNDKFQLLQAISYAGMMAKWEAEQILVRAKKKVADNIEDWLNDSAVINESQRIILVAEAYDYEVLVAAEWLYDKHDVEIGCVRVGLAVDGTAEYLTFAQIFPTPELAEQARRRGRHGKVATPEYDSWEQSLASTLNEGCCQILQPPSRCRREGETAISTDQFPPCGKDTCSPSQHLRSGISVVWAVCWRYRVFEIPDQPSWRYSNLEESP
jgi:hypothetical protein